MPYLLSEWRAHIQEVLGEYKAASKSQLRVRTQIREGVHRVRRIRNYWAHDTDDDPSPMPIDRVRGLLQSYLDRFPNNWG